MGDSLYGFRLADCAQVVPWTSLPQDNMSSAAPPEPDTMKFPIPSPQPVLYRERFATR